MTDMTVTLNDLNETKVVAFIIIGRLVFAKPDGSRHMTMDYCRHNQKVASVTLALLDVLLISVSPCSLGMRYATIDLVSAFFSIRKEEEYQLAFIWEG